MLILIHNTQEIESFEKNIENINYKDCDSDNFTILNIGFYIAFKLKMYSLILLLLI